MSRRLASLDMLRAVANGDHYSALVCVTSCRRLGRLRRYLPHFARLCRDDGRFHLLVALDGKEQEYLDFCSEWGVALVYSEEREGVGLSKNRVLERFGDYDYYFFIEDDVELVDGEVFPLHVELHRASGIHHFSLFEGGTVREVQGESVFAGHRVVYGLYGGAHFNFFTREGLERVGGWDPLFARYRRWGHTEHSHRFPRVGLAPAPFNVADDLSDHFIWHVPPAVTRVPDVEYDEHQVAAPERELMAQRRDFVPLTTLSPHHWNGIEPGASARLAATLDGGRRYPLVRGAQRRRCWSDYHLWRYQHASSPSTRLGALLLGAILSPTSPALRHVVRTMIKP